MSDGPYDPRLSAQDEDEGGGFPEFLKDPLRILKRRWLWMLAVVLLGFVATAATTALVKPRYLASATLLVSSQQIPEEFVRPTVRDDSLERINAMVGNILSKTKLVRLVEQFDLYPDAREKRPMSDIVGMVRADVSIETIAGLTTSKRAETASRYRISYTGDDPITAAKVTNELAALFTESNIERREQQAQLTTSFLRKQLENAERDLREHERKIREFNETYRGELPDELTGNLHKLEQLHAYRQSLSMQIAQAESRRATLLTPVDVNSPEARLAGLRARLAEEIAVHTQEHPNVGSLQRQIAALESQIEDHAHDPSDPYASRTALVTAERRALEEMRRQFLATELQMAEIDERVQNTPKRREELNGLEEKAGVLRDTYRDFLRKVRDAELAQNLEAAQQGERVVVLDRAEPPSRPTQERRIFAFIGLAATFGAALLIAIVLELVDPVVVSPAHVEQAFSLRVLGSVYRIG